jgi:hypothetical protein
MSSSLDTAEVKQRAARRGWAMTEDTGIDRVLAASC